MVKNISKGGNSSSFSYGANRARWQRIDVKGTLITTTTYLGSIERIQHSDSAEIEWKRYAGGAIFTFKTDANNQLLSNGTNSAFNCRDAKDIVAQYHTHPIEGGVSSFSQGDWNGVKDSGWVNYL